MDETPTPYDPETSQPIPPPRPRMDPIKVEALRAAVRLHAGQGGKRGVYDFDGIGPVPYLCALATADEIVDWLKA